MRRTLEPKWLLTDDHKLAGISLGSDFCSEHEWGNKEMREHFGLDETQDGLARRIMRRVPPHGYLYEKTKKYAAIVFQDDRGYGRTSKQWLSSSELSQYGQEPLVCAWDEESFGIVAFGSADRKLTEELHGRFMENDIAFWTQVGAFHTGGGLIFAVASRLSPVDVNNMLEADLDYKRLLSAAKATGIEEKLKAAKKNYFALTPKWVKNFSPETVKETKYPVVFFLNPYDQHLYHSGWMTVEELLEWTEDKGVILRSPEDVASRSKGR